MRKILTSVLGVAGLLAVVLALASSPASAAKDVVTITSATASGTYTVTWETQGGCDPGAGTSGATGSVSLTVAETTPGGGTGTAAETGVVTDDVCNYDWEASFVNTAGAECEVGIPDPADGATTITGGTACATTADIVVTIVGAPTTPAVPCTDEDITAAGGDDVPCGTGGDRGTPVAGTTAKTEAVANLLNDGAVAAATFTVTATPVGLTASADPNDACAGDSGDAEVAEEGQPNRVTLKVVDLIPGDPAATGVGSCAYEISVALPAGFEAGSKGSTVVARLNPVPNAADPTVDADVATAAADDQTLTVKVATRQVYLVQRVHGDAGGASATYKLADTSECVVSGIPSILEPAQASGGITTVGGDTVVELRTGAFNISGAITGDHDSADPETIAAFDAMGNACEASVSITGVPAHCTVQHNSPVNLATSGEQVILDFNIDCRAPAAPPEDTGDMGDGGEDMGGDDMGGDDMGADDMGADDMGSDDMGGDDMDDMGPPQDTPTG